MTGTSPYAFHQSPSFHSSSYLPKMEANFLKDYSCCGITLDSLHELLQHYEENHAQPSNQIFQRPQTNQGAANLGGRSTAGGPGMQEVQNAPQNSQVAGSQIQQQPQQQQRAPLPAVQDVDSLDDMEMDDDNIAPPTPLATNFGFQQLQPQQQQFQQGAPQVPPLNMNLANTMQTHQGMRGSNPSTPASAIQPGFNFNASISSVNTPTFTTPTSATQRSPDSSIPGTPLATDFGEMPLGQDFSAMNLNMPLDTASLNAMMQDPNWANMNFGMDSGAPQMNMTIDEPAKRLFSKTGGQLTQQQLQYALRTGQLGNDEDMQKLIAQQLQGRGGVGALLGEQENKPFRCPVIGCEKAYKNQNGLKVSTWEPLIMFSARLTLRSTTRPTVTRTSNSSRTLMARSR
jgi:transcription factor SFP1